MTPDLFALSLEDLLEIEVVTPVAAEATRATAPATVHVVTRDEIRRRGYTTLADLLDDVPGIDFHARSSATWGNATTVRGLTGNERLLVLLDGHRLSPADGSPYALGPDYSLVDAERVEIVVGPGSALYGPDAFAGVVNVITRSGAAIDGARASVAYGQYRTVRGQLLAGGRAGEVTWSVAGTGWHSDEPYMPAAYPDDFAWYTDRYLTSGELRESPFTDAVEPVPIEPWEAPGDAHYLHARVGLGEAEVAVAQHRHAWSTSRSVRPDLTRYVEAARWDATITTVSLRHRLRTEDGQVVFDSRFLGSRHTVDPDSAFVNWVSGYEPAYKHEATLWGGVDTRLIWRPAHWVDATFGGSLGRLRYLAKTPDLPHPYDPDAPTWQQDLYYPGSNVETADGTDLSVPVALHEGLQSRLGPYGELRVGSGALSLTAGMRLDYDSRYGRHASPRVGLVMGREPATVAKLLYGEAILSPSPFASFQHYGTFVPVTDDAGDIVGLRSRFFHLPNPDLRPERLRTAEVSVGRRFGEHVVLGAEGWVTRVHDLVVIVPIGPVTVAGWPVDAAEMPVNRGVAWTWGTTAHGEVRVDVGPATLGPHLAWTWTDGRLEGDPLPYATPHAVEGGVDAAWGRLSTSISGVARSQAFHSLDADGDPVRVPSHVVLDAFVRWDQPWSRGLDLSLTLEATNALNTRWYRVGDALPDVFAAAPQDPRRVVVGVEVGR